MQSESSTRSRHAASNFKLKEEKSVRPHQEDHQIGRMDQDRVVVEFSDNSSAVYTADQLASLRPIEIETEEDEEDDVAEEFEKSHL